MAKILLRLRLVPDDEAEEVRRLLDRNHIRWFETSAGRFGLSFPAIWLKDEEDWGRAQQQLDNYQRQRMLQARAVLERQVRNGTAETFVSKLISRPAQMVLALAAVLVVVYFSVVPFLSFLASE